LIRFSAIASHINQHLRQFASSFKATFKKYEARQYST